MNELRCNSFLMEVYKYSDYNMWYMWASVCCDMLWLLGSRDECSSLYTRYYCRNKNNLQMCCQFLTQCDNWHCNCITIIWIVLKQMLDKLNRMVYWSGKWTCLFNLISLTIDISAKTEIPSDTKFYKGHINASQNSSKIENFL